MAEPARCIWCKTAVTGTFALGSACPHCGKAPLLLETVPEVRQERSYGNSPTRKPTLEGVGGRAWRIAVEDVTHSEGSAPVGSDWLVHAPQAHPFWWWYMVSVVHLRPVNGQPLPVVRFGGATHEALIVALNPEHELPSLERWEGAAYLLPPDLEQQFVVDSDEQARELGDLLVRHIVVDGQSPDSDHRAYWGRAVVNTAEHIRFGGHPEVP